MPLKDTFASVKSRAGVLTGLILLLYAPYYGAYQATIGLGLLPEQGADMLFGFFALFIGPIGNAAVVHQVHHARAGGGTPLAASLRVGVGAWPRLAAAYISVSFVMLGCMAVAVLPGGILMLLLDQKSPFLLVPFVAAALIWALPPYAFIDPLVVLDGLPAWTARQTSRQMTKGRRLPIAGLGLGALVLPLTMELWLSVEDGAAPWLEVVVGLASSWLYMVATVLCYVLWSRARSQDQSFPRIRAVPSAESQRGDA